MIDPEDVDAPDMGWPVLKFPTRFLHMTSSFVVIIPKVFFISHRSSFVSVNLRETLMSFSCCCNPWLGYFLLLFKFLAVNFLHSSIVRLHHQR